MAVDDASHDRREHRHGDEVDAHRGAREREVAERLAQEHEHRESHHAHRHAGEERDHEEADNVGLANELDVAGEEAFHRGDWGYHHGRVNS